MSTDDSFSRIASLESALEAEKASHTDTLVKLRLTEEALKASEAERERLSVWRKARTKFEAELQRLCDSRHPYLERRFVGGGITEAEAAELKAIEDRIDEMNMAEMFAAFSHNGAKLEAVRELSARVFLGAHGHSIVASLRFAVDDDLADELGALLNTLEFDDDAPTQPMAAKEQT